MDKKAKIHLTNEDMTKKFKSSFELVNYAIKLAENMIKTGRDARVKSELQNRAMLILEEINAGKDHLDEIVVTSSSGSVEFDSSGEIKPPLPYEERQESRKYRTTEVFDADQ